MPLTFDEAERLFRMEKFPISQMSINFPEHGEYLALDCESQDKRYNFIADINRRKKQFNQITLQNRHNKVYILRRLDILGPTHTNPPGPAPLDAFVSFENAEVPCPHIHIYLDGFDAKWALPLSSVEGLDVVDTDDAFTVTMKFFKYCNIEKPNFSVTIFA